MPTATNPAFPIEASGRPGDGGSHPMMTIPCDPSQPFLKGDIIIVDATTQDASVSNTAAADILGVASTDANGFTAEATIDRDGIINEDIVNVWLAEPGTRFTANMVGATTTDLTGVYQTDVRSATNGFVEGGVSGFACIDQGGAGAEAFILEYVSPQWDRTTSAWKFGRLAGVGVENPRVTFIFAASTTVFG